MDINVDAAEVAKAGFVRQLNKPIRQSQLFDAVIEAAAGPGVLAAKIEPEPAEAGTAIQPVPAARRAHILLAEDNEVNQIVAQDILTAAGHTVEVVCNGRLAVETALRRKFDLVVMDCQMPEMDGFAATEAIRKHEAEGRLSSAGRYLPIVALTANAVKGDRERCLAAGMNGYVTKPVEAEVLLAAVDEAMGSCVADKIAESPVDRQPPPPPDGDRLLNIGDLMRRCRGKTSLAQTLLGKFQEQIGGQLTQARELLAEHDAVALSKLAHMVKGAAANLSAEPLRRAAAELETIGADGDPEALTAAVDSLVKQAEELIALLPQASAAVVAGAAGDPIRG
jgi:CheY-like chemotaxis protein/HPt (histidine-containing phosphotransfer) domain-containing protein